MAKLSVQSRERAARRLPHVSLVWELPKQQALLTPVIFICLITVVAPVVILSHRLTLAIVSRIT